MYLPERVRTGIKFRSGSHIFLLTISAALQRFLLQFNWDLTLLAPLFPQPFFLFWVRI